MLWICKYLIDIDVKVFEFVGIRAKVYVKPTVFIVNLGVHLLINTNRVIMFCLESYNCICIYGSCHVAVTRRGCLVKSCGDTFNKFTLQMCQRIGSATHATDS
jgi:CO dehydrogenase/acetyl-CoA synthase alpha subunit